MRAPLNLASQPFRNQRLPNLGVAVAAVVLLFVTVVQARVLIRLVSGHESARHEDVAAMQEELQRLRSEAAQIRVSSPDADQVERWSTLADLVDQRTFSWTTLLSRLEDALPWDIRLVSISPALSRGSVELTLQAVARSTDAALGLIGVLEARPEFANARPLSLSEGEGGSEARYQVRYRPEALAAPSPSPEAEQPPAADAEPPTTGDTAAGAPPAPAPPTEDGP